MQIFNIQQVITYSCKLQFSCLKRTVIIQCTQFCIIATLTIVRPYAYTNRVYNTMKFEINIHFLIPLNNHCVHMSLQIKIRNQSPKKKHSTQQNMLTRCEKIHFKRFYQTIYQILDYSFKCHYTFLQIKKIVVFVQIRR